MITQNASLWEGQIFAGKAGPPHPQRKGGVGRIAPGPPLPPPWSKALFHSTERSNSRSSAVVDQLVQKRATVLSGPYFSQKLNAT